ncbi:hypothetical protein HPB48_024607 [Haemaphysalis longicornis]|uniref:Uncharacterized protein n=1 Tax=Haemaphysalis longicornis TaxID=44386 RepID=A0A9J6H8H7_HAELO|nr:hypothetical protein HPB48_024607 [Haemaphysalis longicornis]
MTMGDRPPNSIKELLKHFTDMTSNLKQVLDEVKKSMQFINNTFEDLCGTKQELDNLKKYNAALKKEKDELAMAMLSATKELTDLKQYTRKNNLEIKGIPKEKKNRSWKLLKR